MKKLLLVAMMALGLGSVAMARGYNNGGHNQNHTKGGRMMSGICQTSGDRGVMRDQMMNNPVMRESRIKLQENKLAMMKEMNKENPNFTTVENLNKERANIQAQMKTEQMKLRYDSLQTKTTNAN